MDEADLLEINRLAHIAPEKSLKHARGIRDPWVRCEALAGVAVSLPEGKLQKQALHESIDAAMLVRDAARIIEASIRPLEALLSVGRSDRFASLLSRILAMLPDVPDPAQRRELLRLLLTRIPYMPEKCRREVVHALDGVLE
jgi:hypothetical protein